MAQKKAEGQKRARLHEVLSTEYQRFHQTFQIEENRTTSHGPG